MDFPFKYLCTFFESFTRISRGSEKGSFLRNFVQESKDKINTTIKNIDDRSVSFYGILRLILPSFDRDRAPYGMKEYKFARVIIKMLCLPDKGPDAMQLSNFRTSTTMNAKDFAESAFYVLRKYFNNSSDISIEQIHKHLDTIADRNANNDPRGVEDAVMALFKSCGSAELQKWVIRIILKDMHLGMGHKGVLNALHPDGAELFANTNSLLEVCKLMYTGKRLLDIDISVFKPFKPMLCKRCDINAFVKELPSKELLYIENKFDGERFQLHMQDGKFRYFSRNGFDYTSKFGASYGEGIYTPQLKNVFKNTVKSIILDGEMMGYNKQTKKFGSKGMRFDVKTLTAVAVHQPCFCVFDVLLLNGEVLMNDSLEKRLAVLRDVFFSKEGVIVLSEIQEATSKEEVLNVLNISMDKEEEGIVVKLPHSVYKTGVRANFWWKVKLEYFEGHMTDLDVLIVGGFYGDGRYQKKISSFLLAILDNTNGVIQFRAFARVSSGLADDELKTLDHKIGNFWNNNNFADAKENGILFGSQLPDVWIKPEDSCVLEVRGSEMIKTSQSLFTTGYTLRFPRILHVRTDKPYKDILTMTELNALTLDNKPVIKLTKAHISMEDIENLVKATRKTKKKFYSEPVVEVEQVKTEILKNYEFCVLSGSENWPKREVQRAILENGGRVTLTERPNTFCLLAGSDDPKVEIFKNTKAKYDIVKLDWLVNILENGTFFYYEPTECLYLSENSKIKTLFSHDRFGDSYVERATASSIQKILTNVEQSGEFCRVLWSEPVRKILCRPLLFSNYIAYFDKYEIINDITSNVVYDSFLDEMEFLVHGGEISERFEVDKTNVIVMKENRKEIIAGYLRENNFDFVKIITMDNLKICDGPKP